MKTIWNARNLDLLAALLILFLSSGLGLITFSKIQAVENKQSALISRIDTADTAYRVFNLDKCIGHLSSKVLENSSGLEIVLSAKLNVEATFGKFSPDFRVSFFFNDLGQLGASLASAQIGDWAIKAGSSGINQIRLKFSLIRGQERFDRTISIPGPIVFKRNPDKSLRVEYLHFGSLLSNYSNLVAGFADKLALHLEPADPQAPACPVMQEDFLDISLAQRLLEQG
ncbi:MAG: hypothetical protein KDD42_05280 [Bdellovibrionales bacterium]|nr:hypothetical protein [Bdellovibrionales bacterium]